MAKKIQLKISQRYDDLSNWTQSDPIMLNGELAIVKCSDQTRFKIGDGVKKFSQLEYTDQKAIESYRARIGTLAAAQGIGSIAAGYNVKALSDYSQAFGYKTEAVDAQAFAWSGQTAGTYSSKGQGTFAIDPVGELSGVFVGDISLHEHMSSYVAPVSSAVDGRISQLKNVYTHLSSSHYRLVEAQLVSADGGLSCGVGDQTVTTIKITSPTAPLSVQLPAKPTQTHLLSGARDFILRVEADVSAVPTVTFFGAPDGESAEQLVFDTDDDSWCVLEPGLNIISFTETKRS